MDCLSWGLQGKQVPSCASVPLDRRDSPEDKAELQAQMEVWNKGDSSLMTLGKEKQVLGRYSSCSRSYKDKMATLPQVNL